jgi:hypothetical protein
MVWETYAKTPLGPHFFVSLLPFRAFYAIAAKLSRPSLLTVNLGNNDPKQH